jgi:hypothetical protein
MDCDDLEVCLETSGIISQIVAVTYATQEAATQAHIDELAAAYDGTPQSVGSEIPTTVPNLDSLYDNALCRTIELLVSVYANGKGISLDLLGEFAAGYQNMIASTRELFGYAPEWLLHLLGSELGACVPDVETAITALADTSAQLEYACCLREELRSAVISEANWNAALVTCEASLTGNAEIIACLMDYDNDQSHALAFFEVYSAVIEQQAAGRDFVCHCVPDGWFWVEVPWDYIEPNHSGTRLSPIFTHTNPANGELFSIIARYTTDSPADGKITTTDTLEADALVIGSPLAVSEGYWLWEKSFVGIFEGADAIGWPTSRRKHCGMREAQRAPDETFSFRWKHEAALGHSASCWVRNVRILYKEI